MAVKRHAIEEFWQAQQMSPSMLRWTQRLHTAFPIFFIQCKIKQRLCHIAKTSCNAYMLCYLCRCMPCARGTGTEFISLYLALPTQTIYIGPVWPVEQWHKQTCFPLWVVNFRRLAQDGSTHLSPQGTFAACSEIVQCGKDVHARCMQIST